jgi:hypothetical protein
MSRINLTIDQVVLKGFEAGDRTSLMKGLRAELQRVLADPATRATWAFSHRTPVLKLGSIPLSSGPSAAQNFGIRAARAIGKGLAP